MAGTNYTRQSTFADGDTITAALFNDEYNQLVNAFSYASTGTTGHQHDGSAGQGGNIATIGDQDFLNKIVVDSTNNRWGVYIEVGGVATEQVRIQDGAIVPVTDNDIDLGTSSLEFKDLYLDGTANIDSLVADTADINAGTIDGTTIGANSASTGAFTTLTASGATTLSGTLSVEGNTTLGNDATDTVTFTADVASNILPSADSTYDLGDGSNYWANAYIDSITTTGNVSVGGNLTVTGTTTFNGGTLTLGDAADDNVVFGADVNSSIIPNTDDTYDLGSSTQQWRSIYIDGTAYLDAINFNGTLITSTAAELNILDGVTATASELNILDGVTATASELNILDGVTATATELNILDGVTSTTAELNILDGVTATAAEINIIDGTTTATATTLADADRVVVNDAGVMKQVALTDFETYFESALDTLSNVTTVGALNSGSITSGFGAIDNGSSNITTTGTVTFGSLADGTITITAFVDEDDMSSNSATLIPTQQSVKAYVDSITGGVAASLASLSDTTITTPADGAMLFYDTTSSKWIDNVVSGDVTIADTGVAAISSGVIVNADINASAAIDVSKTALTAGTGLTLSTNTLSVDASQTQITAVGTIATGTWQGTAIADAYVANDLTISGGTVDNSVIGGTTAAAGSFTTLSASSTFTLGGTAVTSTAAELNILDGVTATATELNILDGVTSTTAELNILDGVTATATELNLLDGVTATTTELNYVDGVTSAIQTQIDGKYGAPVHKSTNYTASNGDYVVVTAGSITVTLPASPSAGDYVTVKDGTGAAATTNFTVARNGSNIASSATDLTFDKNFAEIVMTYVDATIGWTV